MQAFLGAGLKFLQRNHLFWSLVVLLVLTGCNQTFNEEDSKILSHFTSKYCPDPRVCIWNIEINPQGRAIKLSGETDLPEALQALKDSLENDGFIVKDKKVIIYPDTSLGNYRYAVGIPSVLNIRSEASFSSELATQSLMGWPLKLKFRKGDWFKVQTMDGYLGWANIAALRLLTENEWKNYKNERLAVFKGDDDFVYTTPYGNRIQDITSGCLVSIKPSNYIDWHKVLLYNGLNGYIKSDNLLPVNQFWTQNPDQNSIIDLAKMYMGRPYLWGGTSPRAADCSGYTKMVYHQFGYNLPRDASQQVQLGDTITTDADLPGVLPGDFLFFGKKGQGSNKDKVTHVAIYLGKGRMIHSSGQVKIESLRKDEPDFAPDRYATFLVAKRLDVDALNKLLIENY